MSTFAVVKVSSVSPSSESPLLSASVTLYVAPGYMLLVGMMQLSVSVSMVTGSAFSTSCSV